MADHDDKRLQIKLDLKTVKKDCEETLMKCQLRGLNHTAKWLGEIGMVTDRLLFGKRPYYEETALDIDVSADQSCVDMMESEDDLISHEALPPPMENQYQSQVFTSEWLQYSFVRSCFELGEFQKAHYYAKNLKSPAAVFLKYYSAYMAAEAKLQQPSLFEGESTTDNYKARNLYKDILLELYKYTQHKSYQTDPYIHYLYAIVLKKKGASRDDLLKSLLLSIQYEPSLWCSWQELAQLITNQQDIKSIFGSDLPQKARIDNCWQRHFYTALCYQNLQLADQALEIYTALDQTLTECTYITAQIACCYDNLKDVDKAIEKFEELVIRDPYRLENMDTYSNDLYVKENRIGLTDLAVRCTNIDRYKPETCCVIGNYYSMRSEHEHAITYFQRALKLDKSFVSAWTLMGHEYMEINNPSSAIQSYRLALEVNPREYRAWYGLGQTHEYLKMSQYALYYFQQALKLRPNDSRMLTAVGVTNEKINRPQEAKICYWKANKLGDSEGIALFLLAKLYESLKEDDNAAATYTRFVLENNNCQFANARDMGHAFRFLANHYLKAGEYLEAYIAAQKCLGYPDTREEGKSILKQITQTHGIPEGIAQTVPSRPAQPMEANDSLTGLLNPSTPIDESLKPVNLEFLSP